MKIKNSVECWVYAPDGKVLLLHVPQRGDSMDFWQPITGGIEVGEDAITSVAREVREETGRDFPAMAFEQVASDVAVHISDELTVVKTLYMANFPDWDVTTNPAEHDSHHFFAPESVVHQLRYDSNFTTWQLVQQHQRR